MLLQQHMIDLMLCGLQRQPVTTWTLDVAHGEPYQLVLDSNEVRFSSDRASCFDTLCVRTGSQ